MVPGARCPPRGPFGVPDRALRHRSATRGEPGPRVQSGAGSEV